MKLFSLRSAALAVGLLILAVVPVAAIHDDPGSRKVEPGPEIVAFLEARGVDGQYVGKPQSEVPAEQWRIMVRIASSPDFTNTHADYTTFENDYDKLNTLVANQLYAEEYSIGKPVYMSIGGIVWTVQQEG